MLLWTSLLGDGAFGAPGDPAPEWESTITIASGEVSADLTNYPVMVRLSDMPAGFWSTTALRSDGGNVRVKSMGGSVIPHDLVRFDPVSEDGVLFFLASSVLTASDNEWLITIEADTNEKLAVDNANGRDAVWTDFEAVFILGETGGDDRTGGAMASIEADPECFEVTVLGATDMDSHQGVAYDGTFFYTFDDNAIRKWTRSGTTFTLDSENTDIIAAAGLSAPVDHCSDGDVHDGKIYCPIQEYPDSAAAPNQWLCIFDAGDLSFVEKFDIGSQNYAQYSGLTYCDKDDLIYMCAWNTGSSESGAAVNKLYKFDPTDGSYLGTLDLDKPIHSAQGVKWWRNHFWLNNDDADETIRVSYTGACSVGNLTEGTGGLTGQATAGNYEGIGATEEELLILIDPGTTERVEIRRPLDMPLGAGGGIRMSSTSQAVTATGRSSMTSFLIGGSVELNAKTGSSQGICTYYDTGSGSPGNRVTLAFRDNAGTTNDGLGVWDSVNAWLQDSPQDNPSTGVPKRLWAVYDDTDRALYIDGVLANSQAGITAMGSNLDTVRIGNTTTSSGEGPSADVGFCYLRPIPTNVAAWLAAEYANLNDPDSFYTVVEN